MREDRIKHTVDLSRWALILTLTVNAVLLAVCFLTLKTRPTFYIILGIYILTLIFAFCYAPMSIEADGEAVILHSIFRKRKLRYADIDSVRLMQPTMGAVRIIGSGGYMGYWGIYSEGDIGKYFAFYGRSSDCFLIRMKDGRQYMAGCRNPHDIVDFIDTCKNPEKNGQ